MYKYIDIHVAQDVPPSNLNRDDAGSPKQARFGGVQRARVSSQAWKRATRRFFNAETPLEETGTRTLRLERVLTRQIEQRLNLPRDRAEQVAIVLSENTFTAPTHRGKRTKIADSPYLLFFGRAQIIAAVEDLVEKSDALRDASPEEVPEILHGASLRERLTQQHPIDVALFGRMVADVPQMNVDASVQVAHAISTHAVETEFDFFTAVDDEKGTEEREDSGAGMLGTIEFNSAHLYRYATICWDQLVENLDGDADAARVAVGSFLRGFARSMPTGKQNTFANRTLPAAVVVILREDQPVNLVSAFEQPITSSQGLSHRSIERMAKEFSDLEARWGGAKPSVFSLYPSGLELESAFGSSLTERELLAAVDEALRGNADDERS